MLRERVFEIGGGLLVALGVMLTIALRWAGADWVYFNAYLGAVLAIGLGGFFCWVGVQAGRERSRLLELGDPARPKASQGSGPNSP